MNFRQVSTTRVVSECGNYVIYLARHPGTGKDFLNAWHEPTGKHIAAGFSKAEVKAECRRHRDKTQAVLPRHESDDRASDAGSVLHREAETAPDRTDVRQASGLCVESH